MTSGSLVAIDPGTCSRQVIGAVGTETIAWIVGGPTAQTGTRLSRDSRGRQRNEVVALTVTHVVIVTRQTLMLQSLLGMAKSTSYLVGRLLELVRHLASVLEPVGRVL